MDWKNLIKDRKVQLAAAGGGLLGLVVLVKKKNAGGATTAATTGAASGTVGSAGGSSAGYAGTYDSSGTDAYNNLQTSLDNQLGGFRASLSQLQDQLAALQPSGTSQGGSSDYTPSIGGSGSVVPGTGPAPTPVPAAPAAPKKPTYRRIVKGDNWLTVAKGHNESEAALLALNPSLHGRALKVGDTIRVT